MTVRLFAVLAFLSAGVARAEISWLASTARLDAAARYSVFGGPGAVGGGAQWADLDALRAVSVEASWTLFGRALALRGGHLWLLRRGDWVSLSVAAGVSAYLVPQPLDVGGGLHGALTLAVGRPALSLELGLQSGVERFARALGPRFVERLFLGVGGAAGPVGWRLLARAGVDVELDRPLAFRADVALELSGLLRSR